MLDNNYYLFTFSTIGHLITNKKATCCYRRSIHSYFRWFCCPSQIWRRWCWHKLGSPPPGISEERDPLTRTPGAQTRSISEACLSPGNRSPVGVCRKWHIFRCRTPGYGTCLWEELRAQQICDSKWIERHQRQLLSEFRVQHQYL